MTDAVEMFVTFTQYGGEWGALVWSSPPEGVGTVYKLRIPVPAELVTQFPVITGEVA